jgi:diguanylate cyclase (GGDEF)-like protein
MDQVSFPVERDRRLAALARLGQSALEAESVREIMLAACRTAADTLGAEAAVVAERAEGELRVGAAVGWEADIADEREFDAWATAGHAWVGVRGGADPHFLQAVANVVGGACRRRVVEDRARHEALHDALTGLPNRTLLQDRVAGALTRLRRGSWRVALLCVDIDRIKRINETLGHRAGDELLRAVGPRLAAAVRPSDTVARFSGDGFSVLCEAVADEGHAARIADRVLAAFDAPFIVDGEPRFFTASVGVALAATGHPTDELIGNAEAAMYRAKERGRARVELFDAAQRARLAARAQMEEDLRRALPCDDELWVAYQPIHRAQGGIAAVEALVRWNHPQHGFVPPSDFIPVAEECGLIEPLGERILRDACREVARWRATTPLSDLRLSVNISARQITSPGIVDVVARVLAETGLPAQALWLELTEGLLLEESQGTIETLWALRGLGLRLVLDDFGTGYSSLGYLRRYPIDVLKIDRAFVADLGEAGDGEAALVAAISAMARALGIETVAEGVETAGQLARLVALGCDHVQGYHLGRPVAAHALERDLRELASPV